MNNLMLIIIILSLEILAVQFAYSYYLRKIQDEIKVLKEAFELLGVQIKDASMSGAELPQETVYGDLSGYENYESKLDVEKLFPGSYDDAWQEMEELKTRGEKLVSQY